MFKGRVDSSDAFIEDPISILKYLKRHQNWSELTLTGYTWGIDDVPESLIQISGDGSYNSTDLAEYSTLKIARQIDDYDKSWTDSIAQEICERFYLVAYYDDVGYECIKPLLTKTSPAESISFSDVIGEVGDMIEPKMQDIYCMPIFNYAYDYALQKFTKQIKVESVWEDTYSTAYTPGLDATDGLAIWTTCKALWNKTRQIEPMPTHLTENYWVADYDTAVWCLEKQLQLMDIKRCSLAVGYIKGRGWTVGTHFMLQLSHETNGNSVECVVEDIVISKNTNRVKIGFMILDEIESSFFFEE